MSDILISSMLKRGLGFEILSCKTINNDTGTGIVCGNFFMSTKRLLSAKERGRKTKKVTSLAAVTVVKYAVTQLCTDYKSTVLILVQLYTHKSHA